MFTDEEKKTLSQAVKIIHNKVNVDDLAQHIIEAIQKLKINVMFASKMKQALISYIKKHKKELKNAFDTFMDGLIDTVKKQNPQMRL